MTKDEDMLLGSVQISGERISRVEMGDICVSLETHTIRLLALRDCRAGKEDFRKLAKSVGSCKSILHLNLNLGMVDSVEKADVLKGCLAKNRSLNALFLHGSPISDKGVVRILQGLALHPNVVSLDLGDCQLSDISIPAITDLLPPNGAKRSLKELTLSANPAVTSKGWTQLFMGIAASCTLRVLNIDYNEIGDYGAGCLAVALASNRTLEMLDLEGCGIEEFGGQTLLNLIKNFPTSLKQLVLVENHISRKTLDRINHCLEPLYEQSDLTPDENTDRSISVDICDESTSNFTSETSATSLVAQLGDSRTQLSGETRHLNVIIREPTNTRLVKTDIPSTSKESIQYSSSSTGLHTPMPIIRTEVDTQISQDSEDVTDSESVLSERPKHKPKSNYYANSTAHGSSGRHGAVQSSSRNTYDSMSTGEALHASYRKALQRKKRLN